MNGEAKAFLIAEIDVHDPAGFEAYRVAVAPMITAYGGRYLVRGGAVSALEGEAPRARMVVLEFPNAETARRFWSSDEYAPVAAIRHRASHSRIFMVEGYNP
jgi:uncharacterized protein (DUF1330 family)